MKEATRTEFPLALHYVGGLLLYGLILFLLYHFFQSAVLTMLAFTLTCYTAIIVLDVIPKFGKKKYAGLFTLFFGSCVIVGTFVLLFVFREESVYFRWYSLLYIGFLIFSCIGIHAYIHAQTMTMLFAGCMLFITISGTVSFYPTGTLVLHHKANRVERLPALVMSPPFFGEISPFAVPRSGSIPIRSVNFSATHSIEVSYTVADMHAAPTNDLTTLYRLLHGNAKIHAECSNRISEGQCMYTTLQLLMPSVAVSVKETFANVYGGINL